MSIKTDDIANVAKLIVGCAALAVDPSGLAAAGLAADGYLGLKEILKTPSPSADKIAKRIEKELRDGLAKPNFHMPENGPLLLPQMVGFAVLTPPEIIRIDLSTDDPKSKTNQLLAAMVDQIPREYTKLPGMTDAYIRWVGPVY